MEKLRIYTRPKTREDMFKLFEQVFYEVRHWFANGITKDGIVRHIRNTFKKRPSDLTSEDLAMANEMTLEEWMEFAKGKYFKHLEMEAERMREKKNEQTAGKPTNPMDYPTAPLPSDYGGNLMQTAIDFDGSDWQRAIVKIADILEERQECKSSTNVYRWLRKLLEEFGVYKRDEVLLEAREATICWYASQIAGNSPYPEFNG